MIGHLQRNKAKLCRATIRFNRILGRHRVGQGAGQGGRKSRQEVRVFVEVNVAGEESKSGIAKSAVASLMEGAAGLSHLRIEGLMTVPPFRENLEDVRPYFRELRELKDQLNALGLPNVELKELSMGMTHDYTVAIEEGATIVRVGTALFRPTESGAMIIFANLLVALAQIVDYVLWAYAWILLARVVISWINAEITITRSFVSSMP